MSYPFWAVVASILALITALLTIALLSRILEKS